MQEQIAWASEKPDEHRAVDWQVQTAAFAGEWRKSQEHLRNMLRDGRIQHFGLVY